MEQEKSRFFIGILPPPEIQEYAKEIQQHFADRYASSGALKSPPHITMQPPFEWPVNEIGGLEECLSKFAGDRLPVSVTLSNFDVFAPRVIYINVMKTPDLLSLQKDLMIYLEANLNILDPVSKRRPFSPHMTVAYKDLTRQNFNIAWSEFQKRSLSFEFTVSHLTLLIHDRKRWNIKSEFPLRIS